MYADPLQAMPRRETSKRAAKEKTNIQQLIVGAVAGEEELEEPVEFVDSDSDPAWTPQQKDEGEEEMVVTGGRKRVKRTKPAGGRSNRRKEETAVTTKKQKAVAKGGGGTAPPTLEDNIAKAVALQQNDGCEMPFKVSTFL